MKKLIPSILIIIAAISLFACGGGSSTSEKKIDPHPPVLVGEEFIEQIFSFFLDTAEEGLTKMASSEIKSDAGWLLSTIQTIVNPEAHEFDELNKKIDALAIDMKTIEGQLDSLSSQLYQSTIQLKIYITNTALQGYISNIKANYSTTDQTGLMGIASLTNAPNADMKLMQTYATNFAQNNNKIQIQIQGIHDLVVPDSAVMGGVLMDFAKYLLSQTPASTATDPMPIYLALEAYFAQILTYQMQGSVIAAEVSNFGDPSGTTARAYQNGTYKTFLTEEVAMFQRVVAYLMLNAVDYRTTQNFSNDAPYMTKQGLAPDTIYHNIFARSSYFSAQVLKSYQTPVSPTLGAHGSIVIPEYYLPDSSPKVTSITVKLVGPIGGAVSSAVYTKTATAMPVSSRFPNTKWNITNNTMTSAADFNWLFFQFDGFGDLPVGAYNVQLDDSNTANTLWTHTSTDLGVLNVLYYDQRLAPGDHTGALTPQTATDPTTGATTTVGVRFGSFSQRWNWGYSPISMSPMKYWTVPDNIYVMSDIPNMSGKGNPNQSFTSNVSASPLATQAGNINSLSVTLTNSKVADVYAITAGYQIGLPITVGVPPTTATQTDGSSAQLFYQTQGSATYTSAGNASLPTVIYNYFLVDSKDNQTSIDSSWDNLTAAGSNYQNSASDSGSVTIPSKSYTLMAEGAFTGASSQSIFHKYEVSGVLNMNWQMQVVYMNTKSIGQ